MELKKNIFDMKVNFFHLLPARNYGGAENAALTNNSFENDNIIFKTYFIEKDFPEEKNKYFFKIILNYFKSFLFLKNHKKVVIISSLWKSSILALFLKLFKRDLKLILFLHSSRNSHFIDNIFTSLSFLFSDELWVDSSKTLEIRIKK